MPEVKVRFRGVLALEPIFSITIKTILYCIFQPLIPNTVVSRKSSS